MTKEERQLEIEQMASDFSHDRLMKQINKRVEAGAADELTEGRILLVHSIDAVAEKLVEYFNADIRGGRASIRNMLAMEFSETPRDLAYIVLSALVRSISKDTQVKATMLIQSLNKAIYDSIMIRRLEDDETTRRYTEFIDKRYKRRGREYRTREKAKLARKHNDLAKSDLNSKTLAVGAVLLDIVIASGCNIIEIKNVYVKRKPVKHVVYTEECFKMILQSREMLLNDYRKFPIFVAPPKPWTKFDGSGGYYNKQIYKINMIKTRPQTHNLLRAFLNKEDSPQLCDVLNALQSTKWRVNKKVYDVMSHIFDNNLIDAESPHNNPYLYGKLPYNGMLEAEDYVHQHSYGELITEGKDKGLPVEKAKRRQYFKDLEHQRDIFLSNNGKALMMNLVLHNAREYYAEEEIYFSYQYDFRGRIYPIQQHLQPQGKGDTKALLEFADGYEIENDVQYQWFMIHGANCYGYDKLPYDERITKMVEMQETILKIAADPMAARVDWSKADDPFMFLAWCFEFSAYHSDPVNFRSHLPISLDATCSGIQIYSGLLRDADGARAVNVIGDTRNDIYQQVADVVNRLLRDGDYKKVASYKDKEGRQVEVNCEPIAASFKNKVDRKLTKRNTMTQPYSVTMYGMIEQIKDVLAEMENNNKKYWVGKRWAAAQLIASLNDRAITETVKGARVGQEYLKGLTHDLVKKGRWVFYTTPIQKFPVLQKIHNKKVERITTPVGKLSIRKAMKTLSTPKMVNGIAPNFVHSLDATLLSLTVLKLSEQGCTDYHMIHDSFGVPIKYIENLNKAVRESYVELFSEDPLERFYRQANPSYEIHPKDVMINTLNLSEVLDSAYIFS